MKASRLIIISVAVVTIAWALKAYAGTLTMNTYYPAPTGYYDTLTVKNRLLVPCYTPAQVTTLNLPVNAIYVVSATCP